MQAGLLLKGDLGPGRAASWRPTMPPECRPGPGVRRLNDDETSELAERLDSRIRSVRDAPSESTGMGDAGLHGEDEDAA